MPSTVRRSGNFFARWLHSILDKLFDRIPPESDLRYDAERMLEQLGEKERMTAFAMARADDARTQLKKELANHEALTRQAEAFMREGDEAKARRCVELALVSQGSVTSLTEEYQRLQGEANRRAASFKLEEGEVKKRVAQLPNLQEDARMTRMEEETRKAAAALSLDNARDSFDRAAREVQLKKLQQENASLLEADPNAEMDIAIKASLKSLDVEKAMGALKAKVDAAKAAGTVDAEFEVVDDPVAKAQKLLDAPRYQALQLPAPRQAATVRRVEVTKPEPQRDKKDG
jgi:hypothetical protein